MWLEGKVAVVTGAAAGIGQATARLFATEGASVMLADVAARGEEVAEEIRRAGGEALFQLTDVSAEEEVARLVETAEREFGGLHVLFNNAGIEQPVTPSERVTEDLFDKVIAVNLKGTFFGCKYAVPALRRSGGGAIVNNSSVSAFANVGGNISYAASKGAVMSLTRVLALELAHDNIRVNAVCPGVIDTAMNQRNLENSVDKESVQQRWKEVTPLGRMGTPEEVARTVLYLASEMSSFTTGVGLLIDGGRVAT